MTDVFGPLREKLEWIDDAKARAEDPSVIEKAEMELYDYLCSFPHEKDMSCKYAYTCWIPRPKLKVCTGYAEYEGKCTERAGSPFYDEYCVRCAELIHSRRKVRQ